MAKLIDLTGQRFGKLVVIRRGKNYYSPIGKPVTTWLCKCDCGKEIVAFGHNLRGGNTTSCGCSHKERPPKPHHVPHYKPPKQTTIQDRLVVGEVYTIDKQQLTCVGIYNGFARFEDESGFKTCYHYWDLEGMIE